MIGILGSDRFISAKPIKKGWYEGMSGIWNTGCEWYSPEQFIDEWRAAK